MDKLYRNTLIGEMALSAATSGGGSDLSSGGTIQGDLNLAGYTLSATTLVGALDWNLVTLRPDTLAGYGIVDALARGDLNLTGFTISARTFQGNLAWTNLTEVPTTLVGYGITDAFSISGGTIEGIVTLRGSLNITQNLYVSGTTITVNTQNMNVNNNFITINSGETGSGITQLYAGLKFERGAYDPYYLVFDETTDTLKAGITIDPTGLTNFIPTLIQSPAERGLVSWDTNQLITSTGLTWDGNTLHLRGVLSASTIYAQTLGGPSPISVTSNIVSTGSIDAQQLLIGGVPINVSGVTGAQGTVWSSTVTGVGGIVSNPLYNADGSLSAFTTDNNSVRFTVNTLPGPTHYKPIIRMVVGNTTYTIPAGTLIYSGTYGYFSAGYTVNLNSQEVVQLLHEDGAINNIYVTYDGAPTITNAYLTGNYPTFTFRNTGFTQTELKGGQTMILTVETDVRIATIYVLTGRALNAQTVTSLNTTSHTFTVTVASSVSGFQGVSVYVAKASGTVSSTYSTWNGTDPPAPLSGGTQKKVLFLGQTTPSVGVSAPVYPTGQGAIKNDETVTLANTVSNYDYVDYSCSANVSITGTQTYESPKTVQRLSGSYETGTLTLTAYRLANNTSASTSNSIILANVAPTAVITENGAQARLRSASGVTTNYAITVTATQSLSTAPTLTHSAGTFSGVFTGAGTTWSKNLGITDTDVKATYNWSNLSVTGLSLLVGTGITGDATYTLGGFITRRVTFPAFGRLMPIGTRVVLTAKLSVVDYNSKVFVYQATKTNTLWGFTITDSQGNLSATGDYIYLCDDIWVNTNGGGFAYVNIQEIV